MTDMHERTYEAIITYEDGTAERKPHLTDAEARYEYDITNDVFGSPNVFSVTVLDHGKPQYGWVTNEKGQ